MERRGVKHHRGRLGEALREEIETLAKAYIRHELTDRLRLRRAPELFFRLDRSAREQARVEELLGRAKKRTRLRKESRGENA